MSINNGGLAITLVSIASKISETRTSEFRTVGAATEKALVLLVYILR